MNKKIILALGIILVVIILCGILYLQKSNKIVEKNEVSLNARCTDSDGGKDIYKKGFAMTVDNKGETLHITSDSCATKRDNVTPSEAEYLQGLPSCSGNNCYVLEGYCNEYKGSLIDGGEFVQCPNGCNDGTCIPK